MIPKAEGAPGLVPLRAPPDASRSPALVYLAALAPSGRRTQARALGRVAGWLTGGTANVADCPWHLVRYEHGVAVRALMVSAGYAPRYVNAHLSAIRSVLREAWRLGWIDAGTYQAASEVKDVHGKREPTGRMLSLEELQRLRAAADEREGCLLGLLFGGGLRRAEAAAVTTEDVTWTHADDGGTVWVNVEGKGRRERTVPIRGALAEAVGFRAAATRPGDRLLGWRANRVYDALRRLQERAGIAPCTPHDLRRSFISHALDRGADLATVAKMAGHADPRVTLRYDKRGADAMEKVAYLLGESVPPTI